MTSNPSVWFESPPRWFFDFPPSHEPEALAPQTTEPTLATPWSIDPKLYNAVLQPQVPITFAVCYMTFVLWMNRRNRRRAYRPYSFSKTRLFYWLTIFHNSSLALYSGITCYAMGIGMYMSVKSPLGPDGLAGTVDSLCKMSGPSGIGRAITFDPRTSSWGSGDKLVALASSGIPSNDQFGRIWNEGLAFWGWYFYLSKFYEVIDTLIILSKGKRSATLQTYHHAGAMLCMWAGIRYMSPPIWMFVVVNSGIHTLMYTYYTINGLGVKVPQRIKRSLTTMQITQFLVGASYATVHLFVNYRMPTSVASKVAKTLPSVSSVIASAATSAVGGSLLENWKQGVKELAAMVAGSPGIARKVHDSHQYEATVDTSVAQQVGAGAQYATKYAETRCLDTSGQAFAVWLNVFYLLPLTFLFVRFFVKSYIFGEPSRTGRKTERGRNPRRVSESIDDAARETSAAVEGLGRQMEWQSDTEGTVQMTSVVEEELERTIEEMQQQQQESRGNGNAFIQPESLKPLK